MRSPHYFIVSPKGTTYNNLKNIGDQEIVVNDDNSDGHHTNREAVVLATPIGYLGEVEVGDTIIVHHNTFRQTRVQGKPNFGKLIKDDKYWVSDYYLHIKKDGSVVSKAPYVFLEPRFTENEYTARKEYDNAGEVVYTCSELEMMGIKKGKVFAFQDGLNATYNIDGKDYFRLNFKKLLAEL